MPLIHQCHTRNNNPFYILTDDDDDDDDDDTVIASNCSPSAPPTISPSSAPLVNPPTLQEPLRLTSPSPIPLPSIPPMRLPTTPPPRVQATQAFILAITPTASYSPDHDLRPVSSQKPIQPLAYTKQQTHSLPILEPDDERNSTPTTRPSSQPQCSTHLISNRMPCNISHQALYHIINLGFAHAPATSIPCKLIHNQFTGPVVEIKEYCNRVVHLVTKETITHCKKLIKDPLLRDLWLKIMSNELHRLAQGCTGITKGTNAIFFLLHPDICNIPGNRTVTYAQIVIDHHPQKEDPNYVRITVSGNLIDYPFELISRTANMVSSKILWNSVISTKNACFAGADIKNMYLETSRDQFEYMKILIALLPNDIIKHYQLEEKVLNGYVYMEIKGIYGLLQASNPSNELLKE
jgi:hypothetical protein